MPSLFLLSFYHLFLLSNSSSILSYFFSPFFSYLHYSTSQYFKLVRRLQYCNLLYSTILCHILSFSTTKTLSFLYCFLSIFLFSSLLFFLLLLFSLCLYFLSYSHLFNFPILFLNSSYFSFLFFFFYFSSFFFLLFSPLPI